MNETKQISYPKLDSLITWAKSIKTDFKIGMINPSSPEILKGAILMAESGIAEPVIAGLMDKINPIAKELSIDLAKYECVNTKTELAAIDYLVNLAAKNGLNALVKGNVHSDDLLRAFLACPEFKTKRRISHCLYVDLPGYHKPLILTDAAINVAPNLATKKDMIQNAIDFALSMNIKEPKVAIIAAVETILEYLPSTTDAALLTKMAERGLIKGGIIEGPLDFDCAISKESAKIKNIDSVVCGDPDILVMPNIDTANVAHKILTYISNAGNAGLVVGAKIPIALMSRSSASLELLASAALAKISYQKV
ncbi:MAG: bifunctional enoyl-CoA hydratase/phosphate acetyltransferase [Candidatus Margulisiibacteriota bacterium]|jgi:phosphotransacetylase